MKVKNRKTGMGINRLGIICIGIIIFFSIAAIGYGSWGSDIRIGDMLSTGSMDPVFSNYKIGEKEDGTCEELCPAKPIDVEISPNKKKMDLSVRDAAPGDTISIRYTITNRGTIPVVCKMDKKITGPVEIDVRGPKGVISGYGGTGDGTIRITVKREVEEKGDYDFSMDLDIEQYNMLVVCNTTN